MLLRCFLLAFCYIFLNGTVIALPVKSLQNECSVRSCSLIIDAGSTGSRLHVYAYDQSLDSIAKINIDELHVMKIKPGIASLPLNQDEVNKYLTQLFQGIDLKNIPVYFYATGGMRLLDQNLQDDYFLLLKNWFAEHQQFNLIDLRVISGSEEGVFGWLAVNKSVGALDDLQQPLVGVIDIGGASTQLVFAVNDLDTFATEDLQTIKLGDREIRLFAHSFLGLGSNEIIKRFENQPTCMPQNYPLKSGISGQGDAVVCANLIANSINKYDNVKKRVHSLMEHNQIDHWYTLGSVSYMVKNKPFMFENKSITARMILTQGNDEICKLSWSDLVTQYPNDDYIKNNCLMSAYYYALTVDGYGINPDQNISVMPNSVETDWTLGVILSSSFQNNVLHDNMM